MADPTSPDDDDPDTPDGGESDEDGAGDDPERAGTPGEESEQADARSDESEQADAPDADGADNESAEGDEEAAEEDDLIEGGYPQDGDWEGTAAVEEVDDGEGLTYGDAEGPSADEEMPLTAHIEEMLKRLAVVIAVAGVVSVVTFPVAEPIINFLWNSILPPDATGELSRPRLYGVLELWFTKVKVASLAGVIVALPVLVYQAYRFMRPGLYPHERRYYLAAVPTSLVLALIGVAFAYFIVLPTIFVYFLEYSRGVAAIGFSLGRTFNLILIMMGYLAIVFQIPLFLMLGMMMGLVTREWLANRRLLFWGGFLGISFLFSPDPTGMVPIVVAATMVGLFEGTLLLTRWTRNRGGTSGVRA